MGSQKGTERMHACTAEQQAPGWPAGRGKAGASEASVSEQRSAGLATGAAGPAWQGRARERVACADTAGSVAVDSVALRGLSEGLSWQAHGPLTLLDGDRTDVAFRGVYRALELPCSAAGGPLASLRGVTRQGAAGPPGRARKARRLGCAERALCSRAEGASTRATGALSACAPSQGFPARPRVLEGAEQSRSGKLPRGSPDSMWALRQKPPPWKGRSRSVGFLRAWGVDPRRQPGRRAAKDSGKVEGCDSPGMLDGPSVRAHGADGAPPPKQARLSPGRPARPEARGERRPTPMSEESKRKFEKTTVLRIRSAIAKLNSARVERLDQLERELDAVLEKHLPNLPSGCESKAESLRLLADGAREEARRARAEQEFRRRPGQAWVPLPAPACLARRAWALWRAAAAAREAGVLVEEAADLATTACRTLEACGSRPCQGAGSPRRPPAAPRRSPPGLRRLRQPRRQRRRGWRRWRWRRWRRSAPRPRRRCGHSGSGTACRCGAAPRWRWWGPPGRRAWAPPCSRRGSAAAAPRPWCWTRCGRRVSRRRRRPTTWRGTSASWRQSAACRSTAPAARGGWRRALRLPRQRPRSCCGAWRASTRGRPPASPRRRRRT
ncbi:unnamed protein product [Prorocentrum cordatum]|uniref:Uncharacterized protein n=1 Tax=Prorocentrum cordatum TaxID=2364126 RepID=A0ABN9RLZ2_9DINO|nr:unnamed protein product [Polarella glacialis]